MEYKRAYLPALTSPVREQMNYHDQAIYILLAPVFVCTFA
jgi:hypothetical protein